MLSDGGLFQREKPRVGCAGLRHEAPAASHHSPYRTYMEATPSSSVTTLPGREEPAGSWVQGRGSGDLRLCCIRSWSGRDAHGGTKDRAVAAHTPVPQNIVTREFVLCVPMLMTANRCPSYSGDAGARRRILKGVPDDVNSPPAVPDAAHGNASAASCRACAPCADTP